MSHVELTHPSFRYKYTGFNIGQQARHVKGGYPMSSTDVLLALTSQQRATEWIRQSEVEQPLGLKNFGISMLFSTVGTGAQVTAHNRRVSPVEEGGRIPRPRPWIG